MPIFEYTCSACGASFSKLLRSATAKVACSECGSKDVAKQFSTFSASAGEYSACESKGCPMTGQCPSGGGCGGLG
ncbi:MAG: zinc ribbon domain-containing protein [Phycisphaerales bacterium]|jgi:putative FmdB family regulatory protein|nr:zinc ribbon domain-containing protein [Phycisphaerales bacterium]